MVKVDLITGFLGSGKNDFHKEVCCMADEQGLNIGILENDFGAVNVDMMLLRDLEGENCELEMVSGGCDADCHRRRFKTKLIAMGMCGYDRVLIEPSGIFDVDEFFDALYEEPLDKWYQIGNVITILDARLEEKLQPQQSIFWLQRQLMRLYCSKQESGGIRGRNQWNSETSEPRTGKCEMQTTFYGNEILNKDWEKFTDEDFQRIFNSGYVMEDFEKQCLMRKKGSSHCIYGAEISETQLEKAAHQILDDPECGDVFRIKGFVKLEENAAAVTENEKMNSGSAQKVSADNNWLELNATRKEFSLRPISAGQEVVIVIGRI